MIRPADARYWFEFERRLPERRPRLYPLYLPADLPNLGAIRGPFDYVPPEEVLEVLKKWMSARKETEVLYFLVESITGEPTDFHVSLSSLTVDALAGINRGRENVFVGVNGDWAMFIDHEGLLHIAGPRDLFDIVKAATS